MKIRILGSGTSTGVPQIGCTCPVCTSADPKDNRLRTSAIVETGDARILIDCGPDFRTQVLRLPFERIDGVLITHEHYDHVGGLDDLRPFCRFGAVPIYAEEYVARALRLRMPFIRCAPCSSRSSTCSEPRCQRQMCIMRSAPGTEECWPASAGGCIRKRCC